MSASIEREIGRISAQIETLDKKVEGISKVVRGHQRHILFASTSLYVGGGLLGVLFMFPEAVWRWLESAIHWLRTH